jgi:hypothetical protein
MFNKLKYPSNWRRASRRLRRAVGHCEKCNRQTDLTVHHKGEPFPDGRPGDPSDKHDLRRENLIVLCLQCHDEIDHIMGKMYTDCKRRRHKKEKLEAHRALGIGTGLVICQAVI